MIYYICVLTFMLYVFFPHFSTTNQSLESGEKLPPSAHLTLEVYIYIY